MLYEVITCCRQGLTTARRGLPLLLGKEFLQPRDLVLQDRVLLDRIELGGLFSDNLRVGVGVLRPSYNFV